MMPMRIPSPTYCGRKTMKKDEGNRGRVNIGEDCVQVERIIASDIRDIKPATSDQQVVDVNEGTDDDDEGERGIEVPPTFPQKLSHLSHVSPQDLAHERPSAILLRALKDILRRALFDDLSCVHEQNPAGDVTCKAHLVR